MAKVAMVLSGCGVNDGSEIHEAVSMLLHLSRAGAMCEFFAPDIDQTDVIDHRRGKPAPGEQRNVLTESARIARGKIAPLSELNADAYDALFFPGGFGAAKNLCDFASKGADCSVNPDVEKAVRAFRKAEKPIGMCCIAPVIAAKLFGKAAGGDGCSLTVGGRTDASAAVEKMGAAHVEKPVGEAVVDEKNLLVTTPAYMCDAKVHEVYDGIGAMVSKTLELARTGAPA
ncbi:MAG: isoprenoid biosynthesis protein ElbB [Phycisphaeraceae bacterium]|nr:MAG: isoprenoid biosynthesis protein ElbB [Phycisphaeraceae bacterium]